MRSRQAPYNAFSGFSLVEMALALAVISFALVGIMGLLPVALQSAQDSQRETRAAFIAQQIFNDLQSLPGTNTFLASNTNSPPGGIWLGLSTNSTNQISYSEEGLPISSGPSSPTNAVYFARIHVFANKPTNGLSSVQTIVETPANAPANRRVGYTFVTVMDQQ